MTELTLHLLVYFFLIEAKLLNNGLSLQTERCPLISLYFRDSLLLRFDGSS